MTMRPSPARSSLLVNPFEPQRTHSSLLTPKAGTYLPGYSFLHCSPLSCRERWVYKGQRDKPYLVAKEPGSTVKFQVEVGVMGRVRITYLKSKTFGLGDVLCWVDDDKQKGTKVVSWWNLENMYVLLSFTIGVGQVTNRVFLLSHY